ncbi:Met-10+ like-protein-domain-containing protein [Mycena floridula]|nr:Met-10+ like-protein-domain-containing protein [Mycena floridula]
MLVLRQLARRTHILVRQMSLDTSPPPYTGSLNPLDKSAFQKTIPILAVRVPAAQTTLAIKSPILRKFTVDIPKISAVVKVENANERLVLLKVSDKAQLSSECLDFITTHCNGFVNYGLALNYDFWSTSDILHAILPEHLREEAPVGFAAIGHIAHMNLNEDYLPYKHVIGQVFLDKNVSIKTVVNKLDNIDNQFRVFKMELLAGEPNYIVEHRESDCRFTFDFSEVYWNSRLQTEHGRFVSSLSSEDVLADVFAGVGPFALPAAKKTCAVLANDLNPQSFKYLLKNIKDNDLTGLVRPFCEDGRVFIKSAFARVLEEPFPPYTGPRRSKTSERRMQKLVAKGVASALESEPSNLPPRKRITQFVMNLPDTAIQFLDAFRGVISAQDASVYEQMPLIHCYCFTRELEQEPAEIDIRKRVQESLGESVTEDVVVRRVRSVAPGKEMYCITFRLPAGVAVSVS